MRGALLFGAVLMLTIAATALLRPERAPQPDHAIRYGTDPAQYVLLWRPPGPAPAPVAVVIHGGCWLGGGNTIDSMAAIADDLRRRGIAVWDVEYRGIERRGGGYPATFLDIATAIDALRAHARAYRLDPSRLAFVGHSAGGHLALWAASRDRLPRTSPLYRADPLRPRLTVSLGGVVDPERYRGWAGCDQARVARMTGAASAARPDRFADTSPMKLRPAAGATLLIDGEDDRMVPREQAAAYVAGAPPATTERLIVPGIDHATLADPRRTAWVSAAHRIEAALR